LGGLAVLIFPAFAAAFVGGSIVAGFSRYVSLGSLCGSLIALLAGLTAFGLGRVSLDLVPFLILVPALVIWAHSDNIARLRTGQERRFGERA
jgi:glycerol-3-phosphate acyltransferase PlsY